LIAYGVSRAKGALIALMIAVIIVAVVLLRFTIAYVPVGYIGVLYDPIAGKVYKDVIRGPVYAFKPPWVSIAYVPVYSEKVDMWTEFDKEGNIVKQGEWPALKTATKEGLFVYVDLTVRFHVDPNHAAELFEAMPDLDYKGKILYPKIRQIVRDVVGKYSALDIYGPKRMEAGEVIRERLIEAVKNDPRVPNAIVIEDVMIRKIDLEPAFARAVEQKMIAEQLMEAARYNKTRTTILANATAQKRILEAMGEAQSKIILANATTRALEIVAKAFGGNSTEALKFYYYMETLKKLAETGRAIVLISPTSPGQQVYVVPLSLPKS